MKKFTCIKTRCFSYAHVNDLLRAPTLTLHMLISD